MLYPEIRDLLAAYENDRTSGAGRYAIGGAPQNPAISRVSGTKESPVLVPVATLRAVIKDLCEVVDARDREIAALKAELAAHRPT